MVTAKNFLAADKYWYIYIYKISRWSYSILSKVFIWIQSSKKKWFENATFRHDWKLFSANWLLSEFWCTYSSQQALFLRPSENIHPFSVPRKSVGPDFVIYFTILQNMTAYSTKMAKRLLIYLVWIITLKYNNSHSKTMHRYKLIKSYTIYI